MYDTVSGAYYEQVNELLEAGPAGDQCFAVTCVLVFNCLQKFAM